MLNIKDLKGTAIKKALGASSVCFRWHNKNKSGGNFGINIRGIEGMPHDFELSGYYGNDGCVAGLRFGKIYQAGHPFRVKSYNELIEVMKGVLARWNEVA